MGGPPVFADLSNWSWFEPPAAEGFEGSAWFPVVEVVGIVTSAELARRRFDLELPASSELSVDACNGRLILRGCDLTEYAKADKLYVTSLPSQS
jgi:hypothetical protein